MKASAFKAVTLSVLLFLASGCSLFTVTSSTDSWLLYYLNNSASDDSNGLVVSESRTIDMSDNTIAAALQAYFNGPDNANYISPFPKGTKVLKWSAESGTLVVTLSNEYKKLSGVNLSLAQCCLTMSLCGLENIKKIAILTENEVFSDATKTLQPEDFVLRNEIENEVNGQITLYFSDKNMRYVMHEKRSTVVSAYESMESYVVEQLIEGPLSGDLLPVIPSGTKLLSVKIENSVCVVDFSSDFMYNKPETEAAERMTIYSIVNSLTEIDGISSVQILINGAKTEYYRYMKIGSPISRNEAAINSGAVSDSITDVTLYVGCWSSEHLAFMPVMAKLHLGDSTAETVAKELIGWIPVQGYANLIPQGTRLINVRISDNICYVNLSKEFIDNSVSESSLQMSVGSIVASLTSIDGIDKVQILINGAIFNMHAISKPISRPTELLFP